MKKLMVFLMVCNSSSLMAQQKDSLPPHVYEWNSLAVIKEETCVRRQVMEGSTTALSLFQVHSTTLDPGKAPHPPHVDEYIDQLIIVKEGQLKITIKGESKILGPGSVAFAMAGDEHGIENAGKVSATYHVFKYKSKFSMNKERGKQNGGSFMINWNNVVVEKTDKGKRRAFFNRPTSQLEKIEMHTTALNAGLNSHAPHTHKEEEILLILTGNVTMNMGGILYKAAAGDMVFLSSGVSHNLTNSGDAQCEYFAFQWRN